MTRVRFLLFGVLLAVAGMVGASLVGAVGTTTAMPPSVFRVTITNMTDPPTPISPGALVGHCEDGAFWSSGGLASAGLELIAEVGNPSAAVAVEQDETAMGMSFVQERYTIGEVGPGESVSVNVIFEFGCKLSSAHMLVHSNDTFVGAQSVGMWDPDTHLPLENVSVELTAYDAGTEENSEIASGFDGGQPDPSRGAENLDNGVATSEPISASTQWPGVQATLTVEFLDPFVEEDELESDDSVSDDSVSDDSVEDDSMEDDSMEDDSMEDDSMEDDAMEDDAMEDDSMEDDSMEDDSMEDDSMEDDASGFPNGGSGGLANASTGSTSLLTYVFAVLATLAVAAAAVVSRRFVRQQR